VIFNGPDGYASDWFPSLTAIRRADFLYGWEAWAAQKDKSATVVRSIKRFLQYGGPETTVEIEDRRFPMMDVIAGLIASLRRALVEESSLNVSPAEPLEVMLGVPANANASQRFLTIEAFRRANFEVLGILNEPSAASIEFSHATRRRDQDAARRILVYDLGGGTFDASLVETNGQGHAVVASEGISRLGGDDFDDILAELALELAGFDSQEHDSLPSGDLFRLSDECRRQKESIRPNTKYIVLDLDAILPGWESVSIPVSEFYRRCELLIARTMETTRRLLEENDGRADVVYMTGGGSELPPVGTALRAAFGNRVRRSGYTRSATAIGLAIQADTASGYLLKDRLARHFGVWREAEAGRSIVFDSLFEKGIALPQPGEAPVRVTRRYRPVHNIGHFRYLECGQVAVDGRPAGEITLWDEIAFPFDPSLCSAQCAGTPVSRSGSVCEQDIEETYCCHSTGGVIVNISNRHAGYERSYQLGRWAGKRAPIALGRRWR
jgi:molecular chaperone DnaK (HSP70)